MKCYLDLLRICELIIIVHGAKLPKPAKISFSSIIESALPSLHPIVDAGSQRCESLKRFFGLTHDQMQDKDITQLNEKLNLDLVTKNGNEKYNFTSTNRLKRMMRDRPIVILIHGFMESSNGIMVQVLGSEYLKQPDIHVFALDGRNVIRLEYFRSSTYVRFMGDVLGSLLSDVINRGQKASKITLIGHSLGAHIAGVAGHKVKQDTGQNIGRITGLDPAGPCFSNVSLDNKLDLTDAEYVDIIHTNGGILGMKESVGHKDFYPNNGMTQPGCILSTCDHTRAWELYAESINRPHQFSARKCENWSNFQAGLCVKNEVAYMGLNSKNGSPGIYFLTTSSISPFGLGPAGSG